METWLVTGGGGFLGSNAGIFLQGRAIAAGFARTEQQTQRYFDQSISGDLRDPKGTSEAIRKIKPDVILHCAAISRHQECERNPELALEINAEATRILARTAQEIGARFIQISTDAVFDGGRGMYTEMDTPNPFSQYGETKLLGEQAASSETSALILRTNFFGWSPSGTSSILEFFVNALEGNHHVKGFTDFTVSTTYVESLLDAIWALNSRKAEGVFHIASKDPMSKYDFGIEIAKVFSLDAQLIEAVSETIEPRAGVNKRNISLDSTKYENFTGLVLPTQLAGIQRAKAARETMQTKLLEEAENHATYADLHPDGAALDLQKDLGESL